MMDNMTPFMFGLYALQIALAVTILGIVVTRRYLGWLCMGAVLFYAIWWLLLGYPPLVPLDWSDYSN
ncbi:hypothetical protein [Aeromonas media]|uniref:hypothetical protein n=1 Tax=Aeromonas media TaxID=651 RepID=UPI0038D1804A